MTSSLKWLLIGGLLLSLMTSRSSAHPTTCEELVLLVLEGDHNFHDYVLDFNLNKTDVVNLHVILVQFQIEFLELKKSAIQCDISTVDRLTDFVVRVPMRRVRFFSPNMTLSGSLSNTTIKGHGPAKFIAENLMLVIEGKASEFNFSPDHFPLLYFKEAKMKLDLESWTANVDGMTTQPDDDANRLLSEAGPDIFSALANKMNGDEMTRLILNSVFPSSNS